MWGQTLFQYWSTITSNVEFPDYLSLLFYDDEWVGTISTFHPENILTFLMSMLNGRHVNPEFIYLYIPENTVSINFEFYRYFSYVFDLFIYAYGHVIISLIFTVYFLRIFYLTTPVRIKKAGIIIGILFFGSAILFKQYCL
jgi:hypothetical protein